MSIRGPVRPGMNKTPIAKVSTADMGKALGGALEGNGGTPGPDNRFVTEQGLVASTSTIGCLGIWTDGRLATSTQGVILTFSNPRF